MCDADARQEEADAKAKKLSKLIAKFRSVNSEIQQISQEQQREREDMLDTLRALTRQVWGVGGARSEKCWEQGGSGS